MKTTGKTAQKNRPETFDADRLFLPDEALLNVLRRTGTPLVLYDEKGLRDTAKSLLNVPIFRAQTVSVSACPFPEILRVACEEGMRAVCRSPQELQTAIACGFPGDRIVYAGVCARPELAEILCRLGAELLIGSPVLIPERLPDRVALQCSIPGRAVFQLPASSHRPRAGLTFEEAAVVASMAKRRGVTELCLAACPDGNCKAVGVLAQKTAQLIRLAERIREESGVEIGSIHLGSGLGLEYSRFKPPVDDAAELEAIRQALDAAPRAYPVECSASRRLFEPNAIFVASCLGVYEREKPTVLIGASFRQLTIPQMDRYRHISVLGKNGVTGRCATDVVGTDLLAKDWFAESRLLPPVEPGDRLILHDVGCCAAGTSAECCLIRADGSLRRLSRDPDCCAASPDAPSDPFPPRQKSG